MAKKESRDIASFRDPAGYIYYQDNLVYRKINKCYFDEYDYLMSSGLYDELIKNNLLIKHKEIKRTNDYIIIEVEKIPFISYPYEWCFEQMKDAALLTLKIQKIALNYNMILKDASSYNIQFYHGKATFIDTLSFSFYIDNEPWGAYGQFCKHFLSPLLLMSYVDENLNCLLKNYIDGIPLQLVNNILKNRGGFTAFEHIKLHNKAIKKNNNNTESAKNVRVSKKGITNIIITLISQINNLSRKKADSEWNNYYDNTNYNELANISKCMIVKDFLDYILLTKKDIVWDLGSNDGKFSRIATSFGAYTISFDNDNNSVNRNYNLIKSNNEDNLLPLLLDLTNPSPAIGFAGIERSSFNDRGPVKCIMALAIIHHMVISNNVPFDSLASWMSKLCEYLIIEFIPKDDSQIQKLLKTRKDIFKDYTRENFEVVFSNYFSIIKKENVNESKRIIYLMSVNKNEK